MLRSRFLITGTCRSEQTADPDQIAPEETVLSGSTLVSIKYAPFIPITALKKTNFSFLRQYL